MSYLRFIVPALVPLAPLACPCAPCDGAMLCVAVSAGSALGLFVVLSIVHELRLLDSLAGLR